MNVSSAEMRRVFGSFCTGVTVVTALVEGKPLGFTCQSFVSLSLDPPLILISPSKTSRSWPAIRDSGDFAVNILADHQDGHSSRFARSGTDKFDGVEWERAPGGSPLLPEALAWAECRVWAEYDGGDHTIVAAEVLALDGSPGGRPLLFFRSGYHTATPRTGAML